jgi:YD repeat-containing protein
MNASHGDQEIGSLIDKLQRSSFAFERTSAAEQLGRSTESSVRVVEALLAAMSTEQAGEAAYGALLSSTHQSFIQQDEGLRTRFLTAEAARQAALDQASSQRRESLRFQAEQLSANDLAAAHEQGMRSKRQGPFAFGYRAAMTLDILLFLLVAFSMGRWWNDYRGLDAKGFETITTVRDATGVSTVYSYDQNQRVAVRESSNGQTAIRQETRGAPAPAPADIIRVEAVATGLWLTALLTLLSLAASGGAFLAYHYSRTGAYLILGIGASLVVLGVVQGAFGLIIAALGAVFVSAGFSFIAIRRGMI